MSEGCVFWCLVCAVKWFIFAAHNITDLFTKCASLKNKLSDYGMLCCTSVFCICVWLCVSFCMHVGKYRNVCEAIEIVSFLQYLWLVYRVYKALQRTMLSSILTLS